MGLLVGVVVVVVVVIVINFWVARVCSRRGKKVLSMQLMSR